MAHGKIEHKFFCMVVGIEAQLFCYALVLYYLQFEKCEDVKPQCFDQDSGVEYKYFVTEIYRLYVTLRRWLC